MINYMNKLRKSLRKYGLRIFDLVNMLLMVIMIICMVLLSLDLSLTKKVMEQEFSHLQTETQITAFSTEADITANNSIEEATAVLLLTENTEPSTQQALFVQDDTLTIAKESMEMTEEMTETEMSVGGKTETILANMSLEEKIYQLFIVTPEVLVNNVYPDVTFVDSVVSNALQEKPVGGIILFAQDMQSADQVTSLLSDMQECMGDVGLWMAVDEEGGLVARCANNLGTNAYSSMATYGLQNDADRVYQVGAGIAEDISQFGFNLDFAPVADVNLNPGNELGSRIFSSDPQVVSNMVNAMVRGLQSSGNVSATLKHFPGLGAEDGNTHKDYASYINRTYDELDLNEFVAFRGGIEAGADFVMVGHQIMSCAGDDYPSDLSPTVVTTWLRNNLGFDGVVVTDAHNMNTISDRYTAGQAAKLAIQAGVDIVLMPTDLEAAYLGVKQAVDSGEITEERIDKSVRRILRAKEKHGLLV